MPTFTAESVMAYLDTANGERTFQDACNASGAPDPSLWQCWFDKIEPYNKKWLKVYLTTDGSYSRSEQKALAKQAGAWFRNFLADYSPKITTFVVYVNGVDSGTAYAG
ncbi:MAG: hypothetical protein EPN43_03710 [Jatrophihabitans sp.]|nr:MAG: hypothetical protein EPN43_03710 [Jatrophihabitans sp.]